MKASDVRLTGCIFEQHVHASTRTDIRAIITANTFHAGKWVLSSHAGSQTRSTDNTS